MNTKLPPIQYFFGNNDFNNWIRNCKPYKPPEKTEQIKFIDIFETHEMFSRLHRYVSEIKNPGMFELMIPKNYLDEN